MTRRYSVNKFINSPGSVSKGLHTLGAGLFDEDEICVDDNDIKTEYFYGSPEDIFKTKRFRANNLVDEDIKYIRTQETVEYGHGLSYLRNYNFVLVSTGIGR